MNHLSVINPIMLDNVSKAPKNILRRKLVVKSNAVAVSYVIVKPRSDCPVPFTVIRT